MFIQKVATCFSPNWPSSATLRCLEEGKNVMYINSSIRFYYAEPHKFTIITVMKLCWSKICYWMFHCTDGWSLSSYEIVLVQDLLLNVPLHRWMNSMKLWNCVGSRSVVECSIAQMDEFYQIMKLCWSKIYYWKFHFTDGWILSSYEIVLVQVL
jgi:hypothetical protein